MDCQFIYLDAERAVTRSEDQESYEPSRRAATQHDGVYVARKLRSPEKEE